MRVAQVCWIFLFLSVTTSGNAVRGQPQITLQECRQKANDSSPLLKKKLYFESINTLSKSNHASINYPQLVLNAQAYYQTDVFSLPFDLPGFDIPLIPQDQYGISIEFYQNIYNGGTSKRQQAIEDADYQINVQEIGISMHQIKEIVNKLFFSILLLQENQALVNATINELLEQKNLVDAQVQAGAALPGTAITLEKEIVTLHQSLIELQFQRSANINVLSKWIDSEINSKTVFVLPKTPFPLSSAAMNIRRPELVQFDNTINKMEMQKGLIEASRIPDIGVFGFGGYGYPNPLNWFNINFAPYLLIGIKFSWDLVDYGSARRSREIYTLREQIILAEKDHFSKSLQASLAAAIEEIAKHRELIQGDAQIIRLQENLVTQAEKQMHSGIIPPAFYISEVQELLRARLNMQIHQIKFEESKINYLTETGNLNEL